MATHDPDGAAPRRDTAPPLANGLELALREALRLGRNYAGAEHILLGHAHEHEGEDAAAPAPRDSDSDAAALAGDASFPDLGALSDRELKDLISRLAAREHVVSYERRMLHGRMDILRAERVTRLKWRYDSGT